MMPRMMRKLSPHPRMSWLITLTLFVFFTLLFLTAELRWAHASERPIHDVLAHLSTPFHRVSYNNTNDALNPDDSVDESKRILIVLPKDESKGGGDFGFSEDWLDRAIANRKEYAEFHGYEFMWARLTDYPEFSAHPVWAKVAALDDAFERYTDIEWIWMLDSDAIILNGTIDLWDHLLSPEALNRTVLRSAEVKLPGQRKLPVHDSVVHTPAEVVPEEVYFIIAKDFNGLNAGSFFVRRNSYMRAVVDLWRDPYFTQAGFTFLEQDTIAHLIVAHPHIAEHVGIVNQSLINDYPVGLYGETGATTASLAVHFAGCRYFSKECDDMFREYWSMRTVLSKPDNSTMTKSALAVVPENVHGPRKPIPL